MLGRWESRKSPKNDAYRSALIKLATSPATLNVSMLMDDARNTLDQYLKAVYAHRIDLLPVNGMEEDLYYWTINVIQKEDPLKLSEVVLGDFELCDYDCSKMYMIQRITYRACYSMVEEMKHRIEILADYQYDERLGWLLSGIMNRE